MSGLRWLLVFRGQQKHYQAIAEKHKSLINQICDIFRLKFCSLCFLKKTLGFKSRLLGVGSGMHGFQIILNVVGWNTGEVWVLSPTAIFAPISTNKRTIKVIGSTSGVRINAF